MIEQIKKSFGYVKQRISKALENSSKLQIYLPIAVAIGLAMELRGVGDAFELGGMPVSLFVVAGAAIVCAVATAADEINANKEFEQ